MNKKTSLIIIVVIVALAAIFGARFFLKEDNSPGQYDAFAQCLKDKGAIFYGAFWCPHCQNQKAMFGKSVQFLPYVECSTPDGNGQTQECKEKEIKGYPTWQYPDGSRESGEIPLSRLSEKTACPLPQ